MALERNRRSPILEPSQVARGLGHETQSIVVQRVHCQQRAWPDTCLKSVRKHRYQDDMRRERPAAPDATRILSHSGRCLFHS